MNPLVTHNRSSFRFETVVNGHTALVEYLDHDGIWVMAHTFVPENLRGQGYAAVVVQTALAAAREAGVKIDPRCSYVAKFIQRHDEYADLLI